MAKVPMPVFPKFDDNITGFSYWEACGVNLVNSATVYHKFGFNDAVSAAFETIWDEGGLYAYPPAASANSMMLVSGSATDTAAGSGAQMVKIFGLNNSWDTVIQTKATNGTAPVMLDNFERVFRITVESVGVGKINAGAIYVGVGSATGKPTTVYGLVGSGFNQSNMSILPVPRNCTGYLLDINVYTSISKQIVSRMMASFNRGPLRTQLTMPMIANPITHPAVPPIAYPEFTDLELQAKASGGGGEIGGEFTMVVIVNSS